MHLPQLLGLVGGFIGGWIGASIGAWIGPRIGPQIGAWIGARIGARAANRQMPPDSIEAHAIQQMEGRPRGQVSSQVQTDSGQTTN